MGLIFVLLVLHYHVFPGFRGFAYCARGDSSRKAVFLNRVHLEAVVGCPDEVALLLQNKQRNNLYRGLSLFPSAIQKHQNHFFHTGYYELFSFQLVYVVCAAFMI